MKKQLLVILCIMFLAKISAQENTVASGSDITGSGGSVSQSIGQVFYISASDNTTTVSQGVQQPYIISVETGLDEKRINLELGIFPNPTVGYVTLITGNIDLDGLNYSVSDLNGKQLINETVIAPETIISFGQFANGAYLVKIFQNRKQIKSFKLIKTQ
jgi:hypothetical protein